MLRFAMLCYAMLCYAALCYAMLCYALLCYAMLCYAMLGADFGGVPILKKGAILAIRPDSGRAAFWLAEVVEDETPELGSSSILLR